MRRSYSRRGYKKFSTRAASAQKDCTYQIVKDVFGVGFSGNNGPLVIKPIYDLVSTTQMQNLMKCFDQFRVTAIRVLITPQVDSTQTCTAYFRWFRDECGANTPADMTDENTWRTIDSLKKQQIWGGSDIISIRNAQSTVCRYFNPNAGAQTHSMAIYASTLTEKIRYAQTDRVLAMLLDQNNNPRDAVNKYLDEVFDFYPALGAQFDTAGGIAFRIQYAFNITFRGVAESKYAGQAITPITVAVNAALCHTGGTNIVADNRYRPIYVNLPQAMKEKGENKVYLDPKSIVNEIKDIVANGNPSNGYFYIEVAKNDGSTELKEYTAYLEAQGLLPQNAAADVKWTRIVLNTGLVFANTVLISPTPTDKMHDMWYIATPAQYAVSNNVYLISNEGNDPVIANDEIRCSYLTNSYQAVVANQLSASLGVYGETDEVIENMRKNTLSVVVDDTMADADGNVDVQGYVDLAPNVDDAQSSAVYQDADSQVQNYITNINGETGAPLQQYNIHNTGPEMQEVEDNSGLTWIFKNYEQGQPTLSNVCGNAFLNDSSKGMEQLTVLEGQLEFAPVPSVLIGLQAVPDFTYADLFNYQNDVTLSVNWYYNNVPLSTDETNAFINYLTENKICIMHILGTCDSWTYNANGAKVPSDLNSIGTTWAYSVGFNSGAHFNDVGAMGDEQDARIVIVTGLLFDSTQSHAGYPGDVSQVMFVNAYTGHPGYDDPGDGSGDIAPEAQVYTGKQLLLLQQLINGMGSVVYEGDTKIIIPQYGSIYGAVTYEEGAAPGTYVVYKSLVTCPAIASPQLYRQEISNYGANIVQFYGFGSSAGISTSGNASKFWKRIKGWVGKACKFIHDKIIPVVKPIVRTVLPFIPAAGPAVTLAADKIIDSVDSITSNVSTLISSNVANLTASDDVGGQLEQVFQYHVCDVDANGQPILVDSIASPDADWQDVPLTGAALTVPNAAHGSNYYNVKYYADPNNGKFANLIQRHKDMHRMGLYPGLPATVPAPPYFIQRRLKWRYRHYRLLNGTVVGSGMQQGTKVLIQFGTENGAILAKTE